MTTTESRPVARHRLAAPSGLTEAFRVPRALVGAYLGLSVLTVVAITVLRDHAELVTPAVWSRGIVVVLSAVLAALYVRGAAHGNPRSWLRLRFVSAIMVVAVAVIVVLPGDYPLWLKVEQGVCGVLLLGVVAVINGPKVRALFANN